MKGLTSLFAALTVGTGYVLTGAEIYVKGQSDGLDLMFFVFWFVYCLMKWAEQFKPVAMQVNVNGRETIIDAEYREVP